MATLKPRHTHTSSAHDPQWGVFALHPSSQGPWIPPPAPTLRACAPPCVRHHGQLWDVGLGRRGITRRNDDIKHLFFMGCLCGPGILQTREPA